MFLHQYVAIIDNVVKFHLENPMKNHVNEQTELSAAEQARVEAEMQKMNANIAKEVARISGMRGIPQSQFDSKPNESGVRSNPDFDPTAPGAQREIRRAQVQDALRQARAPRYGDATHPSKTGTRGSTYTDIAQDRRGVSNPDREKAIQDILANQGRRAEFEAMSDEELRGEIDKQISANNQAQMDRIKADRETREMDKINKDLADSGEATIDLATYRSRAQEYRDKMKKVSDEYRFGGARDQFADDIAALRGRRSAAGSREERYAINREIAQRRRQERRARRDARRAEAGGQSRSEFMQSENYFPTSPSEFVTMLREQYK